MASGVIAKLTILQTHQQQLTMMMLSFHSYFTLFLSYPNAAARKDPTQVEVES